MNQIEDGIHFFELCNEKGSVIASRGQLSDFPEKFSISTQENFRENSLRNIYRKNSLGSVHLIVDDKHELFQGSKSVQRACAIYLSLIPKFKLIQQGQKQSSDAVIRRFAHNLIKFQKRFKDNFDRLIPDKSRGRPYSELKTEVENVVKADVGAAADDICQMSHRALDLDAQIETLRIIAGYADNTGTPLSTNIKKAMYRLTNPFSQELKDKSINIVIDIDDEYADKNRIKVVHGLFNASIWQLFDNICKYTLNDTDVTISADFLSQPKRLSISMISVTIEDSELETIFLENRQGRNVIKKKDKTGISQNGTGIGLFIVRKALGLMKAKITVCNNGYVTQKDGLSFSKHSFDIEFH